MARKFDVSQAEVNMADHRKARTKRVCAAAAKRTREKVTKLREYARQPPGGGTPDEHKERQRHGNEWAARAADLELPFSAPQISALTAYQRRKLAELRARMAANGEFDDDPPPPPSRPDDLRVYRLQRGTGGRD